MINFRSEKGGALVLTFITTLILSMLGMAILPLTVLEYRSSHNFADFEKSYFIAEAGMEEAIAELSEDWSYSGTTGQNLDKGIYDIAIDGSGDLKTITATGKIGNTQRTIEAQVERTASYYNLSEMKDYAIFAQGDLNIEELGYIYGGIIGVHGDLHFESAEQDGGAQLMVEGEIIPKHDLSHKKNKNFNETNFPPVTDRELMDLSAFDVDSYISWLKANYSDKVTEYDKLVSGGNKKKIAEGDYPNTPDSILIIQNYDTVELDGKDTFNGLIIAHKAEKLSIGNEATINGMLIFTGKELEITTIHITGQSINVNGNIICTNSTQQKGNWKVQLHHDPEKLSYLDDYLPENYEIIEESERDVKLLKWKEVQ